MWYFAICRHYSETISADDPEVNFIENEANELSFAEKLQAKLNQMSDDNATATKKLSFKPLLKKK